MILNCELLIGMCLLMYLQLVYPAEVSTNCDIIYNICYVQKNLEVNDGDSLKIIATNQTAIEQLYFTQDTKLGNIPYGIFKNFPELMLFDISSNGISILQSDRFTDALKLKSLRLDDNEIEIVPRKAFINVASVSTIYLQNNLIKTIEDNAFEGMVSLKHLRLDHNLIHSVGLSTLAGASYIKILQLDSNRIEAIEESALNLPHLEDLNLSQNQLKIISDTLLFGVPNLVTLVLNNNPIENVNLTTLGSLEKLDALLMSEIKLKLPSEVPFHPPSKSKLKKITLTNNGLSNSDILRHLSIFEPLEKVFLNSNNFTTLNGVNNIKNYFPQLKQLSLESNTPPLCDWIKDNQQWLNGIIVWSGIGSNMCGSADFSIDWYTYEFILRN